MRIAHIMAGARDGGAELFYERMAIAQAQAGESVLPIIRSEPARAARLAAAGLEPLGLRFGGPLDRLTRPRIARALRAFRPDIAMTWMSRASMHAPRGPWVLVGRMGGYYDPKYFRTCDHLVGNTHGIVAWLRSRGIAESRTHYLPNFVDDCSAAAPLDRSSLGIPPDAPMLLGLGRLHRDKGFDIALRALARLPGVHLAIAGSGPEEGALKALAASLGVGGRAHFLGWRRDAAALLATCDIFLCSSRGEPLGNMVLEAWSARRPVVALAALGPSELIDQDRTGLLVALEDDAALAAALARVLADRDAARRLATAGRDRYERDFTATAVLATWRRLFEQLIAETKGTRR
ncbi:MAG: glycosyltransferase [Rhodospirillales bacterium]|nr:glycosyltransferase [Rhodospirillales bacterium]